MFTWIPIYHEIASHILTLEGRQDELLTILKQMREQGLPVIPLKDKGPGDEEFDLQEIDPFSFFASFNRGQRDDNRQAIISELKRQWELQSEIPSDFDGIPLVHPMQSWFFLYAMNRDSGDIPNLWRLARETVEKKPEEFNRQLLDVCRSVRLGSLYKLARILSRATSRTMRVASRSGKGSFTSSAAGRSVTPNVNTSSSSMR